MWTLDRISIYPIKSLDRVDVETAEVLRCGALRHDRRFAIVDQSGSILNSKRTALLHRIRSSFDPDVTTVRLADHDAPEQIQTFWLNKDRDKIADWLSTRLEQPVTLRESLKGGFPDDRILTGPTVISTRTLQTVAEWFEDLDTEETRRRFRANLEFGVSLPFEEEQLIPREEDQVTRFQIGSAILEGVHPSVRCVVPSRSASDGNVTPGFQRTFVRQRRETLPEWSSAERYGHHYRLAVNTRADRKTTPDVSPTATIASVKVGDPVSMIEVVPR